MTNSVTPTGVGRRSDPSPPVTYVLSPSLWDSFESRLATTVRDVGAIAVGELGGGANPLVTLGDLVGRPLDLTVVDISPEELDQAPAEVEKLCADLCASEPPVRGRFDLVFSRMLCEHVASPGTFHRNCHAALRPGGHAVHFFPAATALPFALNRCLPKKLSGQVLRTFFPERKQGGRYGKFPAYYSWCWGPTTAQLDRYRSVGFDVVSCDVGVGHGYYDKIPGLRQLEKMKSDLVLRHPTPWLAAYAFVVLRRRD